MADITVIAWWGSDLRMLESDGRLRQRTLGADEDPAAVIADLAASTSARRVRLIYQPEGAETHELPGAAADRRSVQRRWRREAPALARAGLACVAEPAGADSRGLGPTTLLHLDRSGRLPAVAQALRRQRLKLAGAWSLPALLEAAHHFRRGSLHLLATSERSLLVSLHPEGGRWVKAHAGPGFVEATLVSLRSAQARFDESDPPSGIAVVEDGPGAEALRAASRGLGPAASGLADLLAQVDRLEFGQWGEYWIEPRWSQPRWLAPVLLGTASLGLFLGLWHFHRRQENQERTRRDWAAAQSQQRQNEAAAAADQSRRLGAVREAEAVRLAQCPPQQQEPLLLLVARELPPTAILHRLTIDRDEFSLSGTRGETSGAWPRFLAALNARENPWRLDPVTETAGPDFTLRGRFSHGTTAVLPLPAAAANFPVATAFFARWQAWSLAWAVQSGPAEDFPAFLFRSYFLNARAHALDTWPQIVAAVGTLGREPGLTIERVTLVGGAGDSFSQAEIAVAVRLRP